MRARAALLGALGLSLAGATAGCSATARVPEGGRAPSESPPGMEVVGAADYGWELLPVDRAGGSAFSLDEFRGRPLFINMWATWCPPCVAELESIEALLRSMEGSEVAFILVSPEEPGVVRDFLARYGRDLPVAVERTRMPEAFGLEALPTTFIVDRKGRIVLRQRGAADWDQDPVRALLAYLEGA